MLKANNTLNSINSQAKTNPEKFIAVCEERYKNIISSVVDKLCQREGREIVMLAGPSGSGKTTTANKLVEELKKRGHNACRISLDDYYLEIKQMPILEDGSRDFECVESLDLPLIISTLNELIEKGESEIPFFDFTIPGRSEEKTKVKIGDGDVIIVEGLHALNPRICDHLPPENLFKIYISVSSRIYDEGKILMRRENLRLARRMVRDYQFRNSPIEHTLSLWKNVRRGEKEYLFPFKDLADMRINSTHMYEPCVFKDIALPLLKEVKEDSEFYNQVQEIIKGFEKFTLLDDQIVPENSLLREFLGPKVKG